ncbi:MAG: MBOAT family protein [Candidatus Omnitrophica bacterium]|nr:MBOAT family protein [Candidatus Omnitrophota bacterium]MDD5652870.1 MBOAT family protein [Candidatus Omnitrophota bacterium]
MLFNSVQFLLFFPTVVFLYFFLPHRYRWFLLLSASCFFYMVFIPVYILVLFTTIAIDYFAGIWIYRSQGKKRKIFLVISICSTCIVLFIFKYFDFFIWNFTAIAHFFGWNYSLKLLHIILPIGLSFHTFQSLSYVIEVYRGKQKAETNFGIYSLYVMFFPQLVAGPIERPGHLLHQFYEEHYFEYQRVTDGLKLMVWGFFKKVVIADRLAVVVNAVYNNPQNYSPLWFIIATTFFSIQIYCDFSGYSDIAIGSAKVIGFDLVKNFNRPYFAKSITEFWQRWHISLSTWFRDYLYIPLGGNRVKASRHYFNILVTFLVSGLWHGANWTFVIWGMLHGAYYILESLFKPFKERIEILLRLDRLPILKKITEAAITFSFVTFAWIFFRAESMEKALYIIKTIFNKAIIEKEILSFYIPLWKFLSGWPNLSLGLLIIGSLITVELIQRKGSILKMVSNKPVWVRWALYYALLIAVIFGGAFNNSQQFIYFQF